jgi:hypothetical protein
MKRNLIIILILFYGANSLYGQENYSSHTIDEWGWHSGEISMDFNNIATMKMFEKTMYITNCSPEGIVKTIANNMKPGVGDWLGAGMTLYKINQEFKTITEVGTGAADPHKLMGIIPHVIMAWDMIKGPENLPFQSIKIPIIRRDDYGCFVVEKYGTINIDKTYLTTAPGYIGRYGFDPSTDIINRRITIQSYQLETFNGNQFSIPNINSSYQVYTPASQVYIPTQSYKPIQTQSYKPIKYK